MNTYQYTLSLQSDNDPVMLQRIATIFTRRRIVIQQLMAQIEKSTHQYTYTVFFESEPIWADRIAKQLEKQVSVLYVSCKESEIQTIRKVS